MGLARIDSPVANMPAAYAVDIDFFKQNSDRRICIRKVQYKECDPPFEISDWMQIPQLWVEVVRVADGFHRVTPIFRGKGFFSETHTTDAEVAAILIEMQKRGGIAAEEFVAFEKRMNETLQNAMAAATQNGTH
jgi:hypothetical protein